MKIRYFLYVRKSLERDDRQVASIKDQISDMKVLTKKLGIEIIYIFEEKKSAKRQGRPVYNEMIQRIKKGEADGILCWKLNRLARNAFDAGEVTDMLQQGIIKHIQTYEKGFYPDDNVMLMMIEFGIATQYSKDLSKAVKRGLRGKIKDGWYHGASLPVGYKHNPDRVNGGDAIIPDPNTFNILKQLWVMLGTGAFSLVEIRAKGNSLKLKNRKGKPYSLSSYHRIFTRQFYYGMFNYTDEDGVLREKMGKHQTMITKELFIRVQKILGTHKRETRSKSYVFTYRGLIRCGECNGHVTAERKILVICSNCKRKFSAKRKERCPICDTSITNMDNPSKIDQTYYRCTKNTTPTCSQKPMNESKIHERILEVLKTVDIKKGFYDYAKNYIKNTDVSTVENQQILESLIASESSIRKKTSNLLEMRMNAELTSEEFSSMKKKLDSDLKQVMLELNTRREYAVMIKNEADRYLDNALNIVDKFNRADNLEKKAIVEGFASNLTILDKTLCFSTKKPLQAVPGLQLNNCDKNGA